MSLERSTGVSRSVGPVALLIALVLLSTVNASTVYAKTGNFPANVQVAAVSPIQKFTLTEWSVPTFGGVPWGIGMDQLGKIWITENSTNKLARFDPSNNNFTEWNIPTPNSQPRNLNVAQVTISGVSITQVYFTEYASSKIARFNPSNNSFTEWQLPPSSNPVGIYTDENNDVWFTESGRDAIGRLRPLTNNLTEWILPGAGAPGFPVLKPWGVFVRLVTTPFGGNNRFVWFTESGGSKIGRLEANSNRLTLWDLGTLGSGAYQPTDITLGFIDTLPKVVFSNVNNNKISILGNDTGGGSLYQFIDLPSNNARPTGVTFDSSRSAFWFAENNVGNIANYNTTQTIAGQILSASYCTILPAQGTPSCTSPAARTFPSVSSIATPNVAGISQTESAVVSTVNLYQGPSGSGVTEYRLPNTASRPNYLNLGSGGDLWFTESNATVNRVGRLSIPYVFQVSSSPSSQTVNPGQTAIYTVSTSLLGGNSLPLHLTLAGVPASVTFQFSPQSGNPPFTSTLTVATTNATPTGTYAMNVQASSGGQSQAAAISLIVENPAFGFQITVTGASTVTIPQGGSASFGLQVALTSGTPQSVDLTASGLPSGTTSSFTTSNGLPTFTTTLNLQTSANTPAGSYPIVITGLSSGGAPHHPVQAPTLVITELLRDFNLTAPVNRVILVQGSRTDIPLTVTSIGFFDSDVTFSGEFSPSVPGLTVNFSPSLVTPQPNGGIAQTTMEIVAQKNTAGTYQLTITGTSGTPSRTHSITMSVRVSPCLIATATFGSELAPEVQFLRDFRDQQIMHTFAGSNFMDAFNAWYYSFSPAVAQYEYSHATVRAMVKVTLYPLIVILHLASSTYALFGLQTEIAALAAGLVASSLIGLVYFALPMSGVLWLSRRRISSRTRRKATNWMARLLALFIVGFIISEILAQPAAMMVVSAGLVLTALLAGSILPAFDVVERFRRRA